MTDTKLEDFSPRLSATAQAKITEEESAQLDAFVQWCRNRGLPTTRSTAVRTFLRSGLRAVQDQIVLAEQEEKESGGRSPGEAALGNS